MAGITITPGYLLIAAIVPEFPIAMVVLSLVLPLRAARWPNVVAAAVTIATWSEWARPPRTTSSSPI